MIEDRPGQMELPIPDRPKPPPLRGVVGLITTAELAEALGLAEQTLIGWRCSGKGPSFTKLGKSVFYRLADVKAWVAKNVTATVTGGLGGRPRAGAEPETSGTS